ncbi:hypothetical protein HJC23_012800 [Cyclotella cryptica]|uniref:Roadblock/LAMTOR2 domain-containing protein n=1 Tax=Cyclotella cryptica TaxID=29204 RepID=A0ABD3Q9I6_9STRA|eukprot:CCRYP_009015-RB/>CCRYP_009015-RB protein AED:0.02 eAED:0.02 QI:148/1/1/1/0.4/0.33/6/4703/121
MSTQTAESSTLYNPPNAVEMEETIARIRSHKGVECVIIMDRRGAVIQSTLNDEQSSAHATALSDLTARASHIIGMMNQNDSDDGDDELTFLRIRSKQREVMISPEKGFILVVIQNHHLMGS